MKTVRVIKIGGNVVDNPNSLKEFIERFSQMKGPKILIHGGGKEATRISGALGIDTTMIDGRRVTDAATLDVVTMVYAGLINKRVVSMLQHKGINAIGLCGADAGVMKASRRNAVPVDFGFVGDLSQDNVDIHFISSLLSDGMVPVFSAIAYDGAEGLLNCNADSVASVVAEAMSLIASVDLIYCFEKPGVLADPEDNSTVIPEITPELYTILKNSGKVSGGMLPKIDNAFSAIAGGVRSVCITHVSELMTGKATVIHL